MSVKIQAETGPTEKEKKRLGLLDAAKNAVMNNSLLRQSRFAMSHMIELYDAKPALHIGFTCNIFHNNNRVWQWIPWNRDHYPDYPALSMAIVAYNEDEQRMALYIRTNPSDTAVSIAPEAMRNRIKKTDGFPKDVNVQVCFNRHKNDFGEEFWRIIVGKGEYLIKNQETVVSLLLESVLPVFLAP